MAKRKVLRRPTSGEVGVRFVIKTIGTDSDGWRWVATWRKGCKPLRYKECVTDVCLEKRRRGQVPKRVEPTVVVGKSGRGRRAQLFEKSRQRHQTMSRTSRYAFLN